MILIRSWYCFIPARYQLGLNKFELTYKSIYTALDFDVLSFTLLLEKQPFRSVQSLGLQTLSTDWFLYARPNLEY